MSVEKNALTYEDYLRGVSKLKPKEQLSLIEIISAELKRHIDKKKVKHNILELEGLGAKIWKGIDAQKYVLEERNSWD